MLASILFVVPRFHTNIYFATAALVEAGMLVSVLAASARRNEDHSIVAPLVLGEDPTDAQVLGALDEVAPDLIFLRKAGSLSERVARQARRRRIRTLAYDQEPASQPYPWWRKLKRRLRGEPVERATPLRGLDWSAPIDRQCHYLPWPVARSGPAAHTAPDDGIVRILCVAKFMQERKNQHLLIQALRDANLQDRVRLTLVGVGTKPSHPHFARLLAAAEEGWIDILTDQPFETMGQHYANADICVLPAFAEPLGTAPVEAMAYGTVPVISTDCGSAGYIDHGTNGLRVDMRRDGDLQQALETLVQDDALRQRLSQGASATAEGELGPEMFVRRVQALLNQ